MGSDGLETKTLAIFSPYELIAGGGTRYLLSLANAVRDRFRIVLVTPHEIDPRALQVTAGDLGLSADHLNFLTWEEAFAKRPFSVAISFGNECLPPVPGFGRRNIYVCQFSFPFPAEEVQRRRANAAEYERIVAYSGFAATHTARHLPGHGFENLPIEIIHPAVDPLGSWIPLPRRKAIVSVGRFFYEGHSKRQDRLIDCFRQLQASRLSLHLAGWVGSQPSSIAMFEDCKRRAEGLPVYFYPNASRQQIRSLLQRSTCYWHGAGIGADPITEAEKHEHFGISVVEAMSAGCLPFALGNGGPAEIIEHRRNGWLYDSPEELVELTAQFLKESSMTDWWTMRRAARRRAEEFSPPRFGAKWVHLLDPHSGA